MPDETVGEPEKPAELRLPQRSFRPRHAKPYHTDLKYVICSVCRADTPVGDPAVDAQWLLKYTPVICCNKVCNRVILPPSYAPNPVGPEVIKSGIDALSEFANFGWSK